MAFARPWRSTPSHQARCMVSLCMPWRSSRGPRCCLDMTRVDEAGCRTRSRAAGTGPVLRGCERRASAKIASAALLGASAIARYEPRFTRAGFLTGGGYVSDLDGGDVTMLRYWFSERTLWLRRVRRSGTSRRTAQRRRRHRPRRDVTTTMSGAPRTPPCYELNEGNRPSRSDASRTWWRCSRAVTRCQRVAVAWFAARRWPRHVMDACVRRRRA